MCASYVVNIHFHNLLKLKTAGRQTDEQTALLLSVPMLTKTLMPVTIMQDSVR